MALFSLAFLLSFLSLLSLTLCLPTPLPLCTKGPLICALHVFSDIGIIQFRFHLDLINAFDKHVTGRDQVKDAVKLDQLKKEIEANEERLKELQDLEQAKLELLDQQTQSLDHQIEFWEQKNSKFETKQQQMWMDDFAAKAELSEKEPEIRPEIIQEEA